jgi:hypothetical protein
MTYKPQSMPGKPDSAMKHQKFSDLMQRYHGQMESTLYAAEQVCGKSESCRCGDFTKSCPFRYQFLKFTPFCMLGQMRDCMGDHVPQHDIEIPEDDTQAQRKRDRATGA